MTKWYNLREAYIEHSLALCDPMIKQSNLKGKKIKRGERIRLERKLR